MKQLTTDEVIKLVLGLVVALALLSGMSSCSTSKIAHTPSKRDIKRAMSYSTSDYAVPHMKSNTEMEYRYDRRYHSQK